LALQQRILPDYRAPFCEALAQACQGGLGVFAGAPAAGEAIQSAARLEQANWQKARNLHIGRVQSPLYLVWQVGLIPWLEHWQPDVLVLEANPRYLSSRLALRWMHARRRPVIGWGLGAPAPTGWLAWMRSSGRRRFLASFDAMISYSQRGAGEYHAWGIAPERVFVAPNAVATRPTEPPSLRPDSFAGRPHVLFVGRMQARKRLDLLLRACAALPEPLQPVLTLVGDGPALADFQFVAQQVYPQAIFTGPLHGAPLAAHFAAADLFVLPGTGGLAVQQALAHALPLIVAEGDGTQDDLLRPDNGWRIIPGSLESLVTALQQAFSDPGRLRRMGAESYRIASQENNLERMLEGFLRAVAYVTTND
jgi:glycosyltransferase involved in cell wall biosynthesis